jgi:antitoxin HicB
MEMTVNEYLKLPYAVEIHWDSDDEIFVARVAEIPECSGHGASRGEAMEMALSNLRDWIEDALEAKEKIPEPAPLPGLPSGKWVQRVPRSIHARLASLAAEDGVSLNQLVVSILSREIGCRSYGGSSRVSDITSSADPSTNHWNLVRDEIAVNLSWKIQDYAKSKSIDDVFLHRLVSALPKKSKVEDLDVGNYGEKTDHKNWN